MARASATLSLALAYISDENSSTKKCSSGVAVNEHYYARDLPP